MLTMLPVILSFALVVLFLCSVVGITLYRHRRFMSGFVSFGSVSVAWRNGARPENWNETVFNQAVEAALNVLSQHLKSHEFAPKMLLEIFGPDAVIKSKLASTGYARNDEGAYVPINGSSDEYRPLPWMEKRYLIKIRQKRRPDGSYVAASGSTLWHEAAEHLLPFLLEGTWNREHVVKWKLVTQEIVDEFVRIQKRDRGTAAALVE